MKKNLLATAFLVAVFLSAFAQSPEIGTPEWNELHNSALRSGPEPTPQNGNNSLSVIYNNTACGLNYAMVSHRLGQRFYPLGIPQPTNYQVNLPPCAVVQQAFLYTEALGVASAINATIVDPSSVSANYSMTLIGNSVDVCWGMNGTHVWRSDVTASITGSGTYVLSGFPTSTISNNLATVDVEGATLIVIYSDPTASFTGSLKMDDGCFTITGGLLNHTMSGINACANSISATAFMLVGDMQMPGYQINMNNAPVVQPQWDWWNEISLTTSVASGQQTCLYSLTDWADCFTLAVAGLYYQTACSTCTPSSTAITLATSATPDFCNANGTASVTATGGSGIYTYLWSSGQTTAAVSGMAGGTYTVWVSDGSTCISTQIIIPYTGMVITPSSTPVTCVSQGTASVSVSGGQGPYTYSWNTTPVQTTPTITNLSSNYYDVTVTDAGGCSMLVTVLVSMTQTLALTTSSIPDTCGNNTGSAHVNAYYGVLPYSYLWSPGNQATSTISSQPAGTYSVTVTDSVGCTVTVPVTINSISNAPSVSCGSSAVVSCGDSLQLNAASSSAGTYSWSPSTALDNSGIANPLCSPAVSITYTVTLTTACGIATDTFQVIVDTLNNYNQELCFITVDTSINKTVLIWERWNSPQSGFYNIYREATPGNYTLLATQPVSQFSTFTDMTSNASVNSDRYLLTTVNPCGVESDTSMHHRTMLLTVLPNGPGWDLSWTYYEGLPIALYNIYRGTSNSTMILIGQVNGSITNYSDPAPPAGAMYYMIEAVHPLGGCTPSMRQANSQMQAFAGALSNVFIADQTAVNENDLLANSLIIVPNPGNGNFQLSMSLDHAQEIGVMIYDNLGRVVFAQNQNANSGMFTSTLNLSTLSSGVYSVQVKTATGFAAKRLVIE
ncbi:MAG: T9SS type A sorting domain-containing protein [Bacteroidia bacterium]